MPINEPHQQRKSWYSGSCFNSTPLLRLIKVKYSPEVLKTWSSAFFKGTEGGVSELWRLKRCSHLHRFLLQHCGFHHLKRFHWTMSCLIYSPLSFATFPLPFPTFSLIPHPSFFIFLLELSSIIAHYLLLNLHSSIKLLIADPMQYYSMHNISIR